MALRRGTRASQRLTSRISGSEWNSTAAGFIHATTSAAVSVVSPPKGCGGALRENCAAFRGGTFSRADVSATCKVRLAAGAAETRGRSGKAHLSQRTPSHPRVLRQRLVRRTWSRTVSDIFRTFDGILETQQRCPATHRWAPSRPPRQAWRARGGGCFHGPGTRQPPPPELHRSSACTNSPSSTPLGYVT